MFSTLKSGVACLSAEINGAHDEWRHGESPIESLELARADCDTLARQIDEAILKLKADTLAQGANR